MTQPYKLNWVKKQKETIEFDKLSEKTDRSMEV